MTGGRVCAFCGSTDTLTREHVFGDWLSRIGLANDPVQRVAGPLNQIGTRMGTARPFDTTVKNVCATCNNGWMSGLEEVAQRALTPLILGQPGRIEVADQGPIAAWAQKTALMTMYISSAAAREGGHGVPPSEYHLLYQQRERVQPLPNTLLWLARYTGSLRLGSVWVTPLAVNVRGLPDSEFPHAYSITIALGELLVHGIRFERLPFPIDVAIARPLIEIWPDGERVESSALSEVSDEDLLLLAHGREFLVAEPELTLGPMKSLMESPESRLFGSVVEMPAPCGKGHVMRYPAVLAEWGIVGRGSWFMIGCECEVAYLVHTERDGAHARSHGDPDQVSAEYEALGGRELLLRNHHGVFVYKEDRLRGGSDET